MCGGGQLTVVNGKAVTANCSPLNSVGFLKMKANLSYFQQTKSMG